MSEARTSPPTLHAFAGTDAPLAVALPFALEQAIEDWSSLRPSMARGAFPEAFRREEWAHLIQFLEPQNLWRPFRASFGAFQGAGEPSGAPSALLRPCGTVALWLPNNVSLLGPLTTIWLGLTGNALWLKGGSRSEDLTGAFLDYATEHLPEGPSRTHLENALRYERFDRDDPRNAAWAARADVRVVFGTDEAAAAVEALPHPPHSRGFAFVDRRSEAWIEAACVDDALLDTLVAVFAVYGQAGCTSPRRVVLLDGDAAAARALRDRLLARWPKVVRQRVPPHTASENVMASQWAAALGWDAARTEENAAVLACPAPGRAPAGPFDASLALCVEARTLEQALAELPANVQTIGHALADAAHPRWLERLAATGVKRFVPLARMHHFAPVWDGQAFWRGTFEAMEVEP